MDSNVFSRNRYDGSCKQTAIARVPQDATNLSIDWKFPSTCEILMLTMTMKILGSFLTLSILSIFISNIQTHLFFIFCKNHNLGFKCPWIVYLKRGYVTLIKSYW